MSQAAPQANQGEALAQGQGPGRSAGEPAGEAGSAVRGPRGCPPGAATRAMMGSIILTSTSWKTLTASAGLASPPLIRTRVKMSRLSPTGKHHQAREDPARGPGGCEAHSPAPWRGWPPGEKGGRGCHEFPLVGCEVSPEWASPAPGAGARGEAPCPQACGAWEQRAAL